MVNTSVEVVFSEVNGQELKWRSMVNKNMKIEMVRVAKSGAKIHFHTLVDKCPIESWRGILHQN